VGGRFCWRPVASARHASNLGALVNLQRVAFDHAQLSGEQCFEFGQRGEAAVITLDRDDLGPGIEQGVGQPAGAGADFIDGLAGEIAGNRGNLGEQLAVEDEVLAERLARGKPVAGDDRAKRLVIHAGQRNATALAATRSAAAIARGSARSCPAMSNAVPWSGAVRTIGRPSVMLTPSSKCSVFNGISP